MAMLAGAGLSEAPTAEASEATHADPIAGPLPSQDAGSRIRALLGSARAEAKVELAELSLSPEVTERARSLLLAVRALAHFAESPSVGRALLHHLRTPSAGDELPLRALARQSAAYALAAGRNPESTRALLLLAAGPDALDRELSRLARAAILAYPPDARTLARALPWQSSSERAESVAWMKDEQGARAKRRSERCQAAKRELPGLAKLPTAAAATVLSDLVLCPVDRRPTQADFTRLAESTLPWALRGMAAVGVGLDDAAWHERARAQLGAKDPVLRSAAAWFLATASQEAAERLALDPRAEVHSAARNQLAAIELVPPHAQPSTCPTAWARRSTSDLFRDFTAGAEQGEFVLGCLASRLRRDPGPGLRALDLEASWETTPDVARVLVASALGHAAPDTQPLARGLAERLFSAEGDAYVRRFLCLSLAELGLGPEESLSVTLRVDPDPICRAIGAGRAPFPPSGAGTGGAASGRTSPGSAAVSTVATQKRHFAARELLPPLVLTAAPDGFVGARLAPMSASPMAELDFVDCRETGEPTWACGPTGQKPR